MKLYYMPASPPSRSVLMTIRCLGLEVETILIDLLKGEQKSPEFLKLNPLGQVPVIEDDDFVLSESRAIMTYLVNAKKPGSTFYPIDPKKRAIIDSRLQFDAANIFSHILNAMHPIFFNGEKEVSTEIREKLKQSLRHLENILNENSYVAGDEPTLADISILSNIVYLKSAFGEIGNLPNIEAWYKRCENLAGYEENVKGGEFIGHILEKMDIKLASLE